MLLDFEPLNSIFTDKNSESLEAAWAAFGKNNRLVMLTLQVPPMSEPLMEPFKDYPWRQSRLADLPWYKAQPLRAGFGLQCDHTVDRDPNLPAVFLVGPDGKIAARDLHGDAIKTALAAALEKK